MNELSGRENSAWRISALGWSAVNETTLGDFRTNRRMLLPGLALPVGALSAVLAKALLWLIAVITNLVFFQRFSPELIPLTQHHLGAWVIAAPVAGAIVIWLMARYGSE